jgi:hypothetical protein
MRTIIPFSKLVEASGIEPDFSNFQFDVITIPTQPPIKTTKKPTKLNSWALFKLALIILKHNITNLQSP